MSNKRRRGRTTSSKKFRLFKERNNSLQAAMMRGRRAISEDFWALKDVSFEVPRAAPSPDRPQRVRQEHHAQVPRQDPPPRWGTWPDRWQSIACLNSVPDSPSCQGGKCLPQWRHLGPGQKELHRPLRRTSSSSPHWSLHRGAGKKLLLGYVPAARLLGAINVDPDVLLIDEVLLYATKSFSASATRRSRAQSQKQDDRLVSHAMVQVHNCATTWPGSSTATSRTRAGTRLVSAYTGACKWTTRRRGRSSLG